MMVCWPNGPRRGTHCVPHEPVHHRRDQRIDLLRGVALAMIFVNHVPGTIWEQLTSRNFGFSDAAEAFVLMSGIAAGIAFGPAFLAAAPLRARLRPWRRAVTLWGVHVLISVLILLIFALMRWDPAIAQMAKARNIVAVLNDPAGYLPSLGLLAHQFAYADILPLYVVLMIAGPGILWLAVRWPRALMAGSLGLWFVTGLLRIRVPTWPQDNAWFFNPLSWQVLFVAGILTGLAIRQRRRWLPVRRWAVALAWGIVALAAIWRMVPVVADWGGHAFWALHEYAGLPGVLTGFDKSFLFLPRLLHIAALAYALSTLPALRRLADSRHVAPLTLMGRHSLPVFATGTVLAYLGQITKAIAPPSHLLDAAIIWGGLAILYLVARWRESRKNPAPAGPSRAGLARPATT